METKKIINKMFGSSIEQKEACVEDEGITYNIKLSTCNNICTITVKTKVKNSKEAAKYVEILNKTQSDVFHYGMDGNNIVCTVGVWVDHKINKSSLSELLSTIDSNFKSVLNYLGQVNKNYA